MAMAARIDAGSAIQHLDDGDTTLVQVAPRISEKKKAISPMKYSVSSYANDSV
jgi:hypothetical protein